MPNNVIKNTISNCPVVAAITIALHGVATDRRDRRHNYTQYRKS